MRLFILLMHLSIHAPNIEDGIYHCTILICKKCMVIGTDVEQRIFGSTLKIMIHFGLS